MFPFLGRWPRAETTRKFPRPSMSTILGRSTLLWCGRGCPGKCAPPDLADIFLRTLGLQSSSSPSDNPTFFGTVFQGITLLGTTYKGILC